MELEQLFEEVLNEGEHNKRYTVKVINRNTGSTWKEFDDIGEALNYAKENLYPNGICQEIEIKENSKNLMRKIREPNY